MRRFALAFLVAWVLSRLAFHLLGIAPANWGAPPLVWAQDFIIWCFAYGAGYLMAHRVWRESSTKSRS